MNTLRFIPRILKPSIIARKSLSAFTGLCRPITTFQNPASTLKKAIIPSALVSIAALSTLKHSISSEPSPIMPETTTSILGEIDIPDAIYTYRLRLPPNKPFDPTKPVLVFIHGLLVDSLIWDVTMDLVAQSGYQCLAIDLPLGCHTHPVRDRKTLTFEDIARNVDEVLEKLGVRKCVIVGNDTGGVVVQKFIQRDVEKAESFENFLPAVFMPLIIAIRNLPGTSLVSLLGTLFASPTLSSSPLLLGWLMKKGIPPDVASRVRTTNPEIHLDTKHLLLDIRNDITMRVAKDLHRFRRPCLIVTCPEDTVFFSEKYILRLAEAFKGPTDPKYEGNMEGRFEGVEVRQVQDSYAFVMVDQPGELAKLIVEFMGDKRF
ncbi:Alpha/Beta hydrolase protein [Chytridium lagenaria]|nr:Alpha/Beta hydrolase protein [Chytridium lagenaria]